MSSQHSFREKGMNNRERQGLDRYITGNYGEDQFKNCDEEFWPAPSAHRSYWELQNNLNVYEYDPTDDGPEIVIFERFKATFPFTWDPALNRVVDELSRSQADWLFTTLAALSVSPRYRIREKLS
jgi:hypothetical protein